ncbi:MAG TPA: serine hydrolase [Phycisphaerales bacterium]
MAALGQILDRLGPGWTHVLQAPERLRLQICLTPLSRAGMSLNAPTETFRADAEYFYPASTVKLLAALCVLRRVRALRAQGGAWSGFSLDTPLAFFPENAEPITADDTNLEGGELTLRHCIRRALIVSENPPHNRLYEFLGHEGINAELQGLGFTGCVINHRLDDVRSPEQQRTTPRIVAMLRDGSRLEIPHRVGAVLPYPRDVRQTRIGSAFFRDGVRIEGPMDFAAVGEEKNRVRLSDLHALICRLHPRGSPAEHDAAARDLQLASEDLSFLHECMTILPRASVNPRYDADQYPDDYAKPMLPGVHAVDPNARITNKLGWAYGFVTDTGVLWNTAGDAFALSFSLWACAGGVLGNDDYEYDSVAKVFAADLARAAAAHLWESKVR